MKFESTNLSRSNETFIKSIFDLSEFFHDVKFFMRKLCRNIFLFRNSRSRSIHLSQTSHFRIFFFDLTIFDEFLKAVYGDWLRLFHKRFCFNDKFENRALMLCLSNFCVKSLITYFFFKSFINLSFRLLNKFFEFRFYNTILELIIAFVFYKFEIIDVERDIVFIKCCCQICTCCELFNDYVHIWIDFDQSLIWLELNYKC